MSVIRRLYNVAYGKVRTALDPSAPPPDAVDKELREPAPRPPPPLPEDRATDPVTAEPTAPRPRRL